MGTRSNIQFIYGNEKFQLYKHWDGYPSGIIPNLAKFLKWNGMRNDDISYTVANFILWVKLEASKHDYKGRSIEEQFEKAESNISTLHTGIGLVDVCEPEDLDDDVWIEYFYKVDLKNKKIEVYNPTELIYVFDYQKTSLDELEKFNDE